MLKVMCTIIFHLLQIQPITTSPFPGDIYVCVKMGLKDEYIDTTITRIAFKKLETARIAYNRQEEGIWMKRVEF